MYRRNGFSLGLPNETTPPVSLMGYTQVMKLHFSLISKLTLLAIQEKAQLCAPMNSAVEPKT